MIFFPENCKFELFFFQISLTKSAILLCFINSYGTSPHSHSVSSNSRRLQKCCYKTKLKKPTTTWKPKKSL